MYSMGVLKGSWRGRHGLFAVMLFAALSPTAFAADYEIPRGSATIDGDLSDWAGANWISMEQVYHGDPFDMSGARWAARWESDMIYLAATVVDTDHVFNTAHAGWDAQDALEVYLDPANRNVDRYDLAGFVDSQEWVLSSTGVDDGEWICLALYPLAEDQTAVPEFEISVDGNNINYEIAMRPYDSFDQNDPAASSILALSAGMVVGLDVVIDSKWSDGFGMLCENQMTSKWSNALQFQDYVLVSESGVLDGDLNGDGSVNSNDLDVVRANWGQAVSGAANGDPSGDGFVGSDDLDIIRANWGRTATASAIPEPGMLALLLAAAVGLASLRRR